MERRKREEDRARMVIEDDRSKIVAANYVIVQVGLNYLYVIFFAKLCLATLSSRRELSHNVVKLNRI